MRLDQESYDPSTTGVSSDRRCSAAAPPRKSAGDCSRAATSRSWTLLLSLFTASLLFPACAQPPAVKPKISGLASYATNIDNAYVGSWKATNGDVFAIGSGSDDTLIIVQSKKLGGAEALSGRIINVNGTYFGEIAIPSGGPDAVPVFAYAKFQARLNSLEYTPISAEWLRVAVSGDPGVAFGSAASVDAAAGGVVVQSPARLFQLLQLAAKDPTAFAATETFVRIPQ